MSSQPATLHEAVAAIQAQPLHELEAKLLNTAYFINPNIWDAVVRDKRPLSQRILGAVAYKASSDMVKAELLLRRLHQKVDAPEDRSFATAVIVLNMSRNLGTSFHRYAPSIYNRLYRKAPVWVLRLLIERILREQDTPLIRAFGGNKPLVEWVTPIINDSERELMVRLIQDPRVPLGAKANLLESLPHYLRTPFMEGAESASKLTGIWNRAVKKTDPRLAGLPLKFALVAAKKLPSTPGWDEIPSDEWIDELGYHVFNPALGRPARSWEITSA